MKAEFSRLTFDPRKHYAGVLQQQGRVGLDADWNEWVEMSLHRLTVETRDVIGSCGRPKHAPGFVISVDSTVTPPNLLISDGRLYAGGMLAESSSIGKKGTSFSAQPDWPIPSQEQWSTLQQTLPSIPPWPGLDLSAAGNGNINQLVYAEVWHRHLTALNDEARRDEAFTNAGGNPDWNAMPEVGDFVRERALGGPDTCTRLQTVAQVKLWDYSDKSIQTCDEACAALAQARPPKTAGTMQLDVTPTPPVTSPCQEPLQGGYGGAFNLTYRVEIHDGGAAGTGTFKWSTENAAFCVRINGTALASAATGTDILITSIGNDQNTQLSANDWVEVCGEETELGVFQNPLAQVVADPVANADGTWTIQLTGPAVIPHAPFLRRWSANVQTIQLNQPFNLDAGSGLAVTFFDETGTTGGTTYFHSQDYWTWSARTDIRAVEPETLANVPQPPRGIARHYCCLAMITWAEVNGQVTATANAQCTPIFPPLTELPTGDCGCCCVISVGDGVVSSGDYTSLSEAFASLPDTSSRGGIVVCLAEGNYHLPAAITLTQDRVTIRGCGVNTVIHAPAGAFILNKRREVTFSNLVIESWTSPAIIAVACSEISLRDSRIRMAPDSTVQAQPSSDKQKASPSQTLQSPNATSTQPQLSIQFPAQVPALLLQGWLFNIERNEIRGAWNCGGIGLLGHSGQFNISGNLIHKSSLPGINFNYALSDQSFKLTADGATFETFLITDNIFRDINAQAILQDIAGTFLKDSSPTPPPPKAVNKTVAATAATKRKDVNLPPPPRGVAGLTITHNLITYCGTGSTIDLQGATPTNQKNATLVQEAAESKGAQMSAISLALVERLLIADNRILKNGLRDFAYAAIIVGIAEGMILRQNIISENGITPSATPQFSGGVLIELARTELGGQKKEKAADSEGWLALVVDDNVIDSLNGPALAVGGAGSMRFTRNRFAATVAGITTVALLIDNIGQAIETSPLIANNADYVQAVSPLATVAPPPNPLIALGGQVQFSENHITSIVTNQTGLPILMVSGDDISFTNNQLQVLTGTNLLVQNFKHVAIASATLRIIGNRLTEPLNDSVYSCLAGATAMTVALNQSTHCFAYLVSAPLGTELNYVDPPWSGNCINKPLNDNPATTLAPINAARAAGLKRIRTLLTRMPGTQYTSMVAAIDNLQLTASRLPAASPDSFTLHGRILDSSGKPVAAASIALTDAKGVLNQRLAAVKTDAQGFYTITLRTAEFPELEAGQTEIFVTATNAKSQQIAKPEQPILYQPGKVALLPIVT